MGLISTLKGNAGQVSNSELDKEFGKLMASDEKIEAGYKVIRDLVIFTNKRLILIDKQGVTAKKIEYLSIFYNSITRFSIETEGHMDLDAELKIWISGKQDPVLNKTFDEDVNVYELQKIIAGNI